MLKRNIQSNKQQDDFDEEFYLDSNPDVKIAVSMGDYKSGRDHYEKFGCKENRANHPTPKTKYDLINWFGKRFNFSSYLEISTLTTGHYFDKVDSNLFKIKDCINYFVKEHESLYPKSGNAPNKDHNFKILSFDNYLKKIIDKKQKYDVIFVDPFHTVKHTIRDLETALSLLSKKGVIIVHDCFPNSEALVGSWKDGVWCGQTYEGYIRFLLDHSKFENFVIDIDYGCGIIRPHVKSRVKRDYVDVERLSDWEYFGEHHKKLLNLESSDKIYELYLPKNVFKFFR